MTDAQDTTAQGGSEQEQAPVAAQAAGRMAAAAAAAAAVFTAVVCVLTVATHLQLKTHDPLNNPELVALREQYAQDQKNETLKSRIRALDFLVRKAYFTSREQVTAGGRLLLGGAAVMFIALGVWTACRPRIPHPGAAAREEAVWAGLARARWWVVAVGALLAAMGLLALVALRTELSREVWAGLPEEGAVGGEEPAPADEKGALGPVREKERAAPAVPAPEEEGAGPSPGGIRR